MYIAVMPGIHNQIMMSMTLLVTFTCRHLGTLCYIAKPSLKIKSVNKAFSLFVLILTTPAYDIFLRIKRVFFFEIAKLKLSGSVWKIIFWNLTKFQLNQKADRKNENNNSLNQLNELKFCEVSQNYVSKRC